LQQTWDAMAGDGAASFEKLSLETPQTLALNVGGVNFSDAYRHIGGLIDALNGDQQLLDKSGLDDLLYRLTVMLMRPKAFIDGDLASTSQVNAASLDQLCQYIRANLGKRITMTELEMLSGSSSRTLQYQFKHRFNCSPMRWISQQRLDACRARFLSAQANESVTMVALAYGFTNLGNFARMYAERFGERPSETLKNN
jgi:transcriptional regulator GlxA family with amidase domain